MINTIQYIQYCIQYIQYCIFRYINRLSPITVITGSVITCYASLIYNLKQSCFRVTDYET